ncbi:hypothetical protein [Agromyces sp. GXQ0307]|uniref:hypothetical protein n=1 Tax=Agromyces sp. GXQ0307 TaxID=3377835 RepID=UPI00383A545C
MSGLLDEDTNRLVVDIGRPSDAELAGAFPHGSVTLALVSAVDGDGAELALHPSHRVRVYRTDVSPNPLDRVDLLLSAGEVVAARVIHLSTGALHLRLSDVDDDDPIMPPLTLVAGGTPWLRQDRPLPTGTVGGPEAVEAQLEALHAEESLSTESSTFASESPTSTAATPPRSPASPVAAPADAPPSTPRPMPGPGLRRAAATSNGGRSAAPIPGAPAPEPAVPAPEATPSSRSALQTTQLELESERVRRLAAEERLVEAGVSDSALSRLRTAAELDRRRVRELLVENADLRAEADALRRDRADGARRLRDYVRRGSAQPQSVSRTAAARRADFPDAEAWVRHEISCAWVDRIPACDKIAHPLADFAIGPEFASMLEPLDADKFAKALKAVVDVLTGRAEHMDGREVHRLRASEAGGSPYLVREDGAHAMRCAIERNTPSARRLHYWVMPGGKIELSRVDVHDAVKP